jgi:hypothetical protein
LQNVGLDSYCTVHDGPYRLRPLYREQTGAVCTAMPFPLSGLPLWSRIWNASDPRRAETGMRLRLGGTLLFWIAITACSQNRKSPAETTQAGSQSPDGYRVISHDSQTGQWVIIRSGTFSGEHQTKRLIVICESYQWGEREPVRGPSACYLQIGRLMVSNAYDFYSHKTKESLLDITELPSDWISFVEGIGDDRVRQSFRIARQELLPGSTSK